MDKAEYRRYWGVIWAGLAAVAVGAVLAIIILEAGRNLGLEDAHRVTYALRDVNMGRMRKALAKQPEELLKLLEELVTFKETMTHELRSTGIVRDGKRFNETVDFINVAYGQGEKPIVVITLDRYPRVPEAMPSVTRRRMKRDQ